MLSVVLSATSFSFATILISSFADWSGVRLTFLSNHLSLLKCIIKDVEELKSDILAWSILFSIPNITLAW